MGGRWVSLSVSTSTHIFPPLAQAEVTIRTKNSTSTAIFGFSYLRQPLFLP